MPRELTERPPKTASYDPDDIRVGENIRRAYSAKKQRLRAKKKRYSIETLAANVGLERSSMNKILLGRKVSAETLLRIMQELRAKPREILRGVEKLERWQSLFDEGVTMTRSFKDRSKRRGSRSLIELLDDDAQALARLNDFLGGCDIEGFLWARKNLLMIQQTLIRRRRNHIKAGTWTKARFTPKAIDPSDHPERSVRRASTSDRA